MTNAHRNRGPRRSRRGGWTLIELLMTIIIAAILVGILLPTLVMSKRAAWRTRYETELRSVGQMLHNYATDHNDVLPTQGQTLDWSKGRHWSGRHIYGPLGDPLAPGTERRPVGLGLLISEYNLPVEALFDFAEQELIGGWARQHYAMAQVAFFDYPTTSLNGYAFTGEALATAEQPFFTEEAIEADLFYRGGDLSEIADDGLSVVDFDNGPKNAETSSPGFMDRAIVAGARAWHLRVGASSTGIDQGYAILYGDSTVRFWRKHEGGFNYFDSLTAIGTPVSPYPFDWSESGAYLFDQADKYSR